MIDDAKRPPEGAPWSTTTDRAPGRTRLAGAVPFGLVLIALGVVLLLDNLDVVDATDLLAGWWPVAVIGAGVWWLAAGARWAGLAIVVVGLLLLATTLDLVDADAGNLVFPVVSLVLGGALLNAGARVRAARGADGRPVDVFAWGHDDAGGWPTGDLAATAVFGDARLVVGADVGDGRVTVTVRSMFGDVRVEAPHGWRIVDHTTRVLGDVELPRDRPTAPDAPVVELHGLALLGDVRVSVLDGPGAGR